MYLRAVDVNHRPRDPVETRQIKVCRVCDPEHFKPWMAPRWEIFGDFLGPAFPAIRVQHISDLHRTKATPCVKYSRLLRLGEDKKKERRKKPQGKNIMACPITYGDHNKWSK